VPRCFLPEYEGEQKRKRKRRQVGRSFCWKAAEVITIIVKYLLGGALRANNGKPRIPNAWASVWGVS
jgi:hypothetical protein